MRSDPRYACTSGRRRRWNRRHRSANCLVVADFRASTRDAPPGYTPHGRHLMGRGVLPPPSTWRWDIMLVATCIHFALSIAYAVIPALLAWRLRTVSALFAGALYGLAICGVNLYGLIRIDGYLSLVHRHPRLDNRSYSRRFWHHPGGIVQAALVRHGRSLFNRMPKLIRWFACASEAYI